MNTQILHRYIAPRSFYRTALGIALPIMAQQLIQSLVSLVDNFMVAGLGDVAMSGVNVAGQVLFVFQVLLNTICMAGGIYMSQYFGAGDREGMRQALRFKIIAAGAAGIAYIFTCMGIPRTVLSWMVIGNTQAEEILDQGTRYMFLMGFMGVPVTISMILASSMREIGDVKTPLVITVIATLLNTFFNWVLIYGHLGAPALGVSGAAYATLIARTAEMALFLAVTARKKPPFSVPPRELFRVDLRLFRKILRKGLLVMCTEMAWVLYETVTTALYNGRGGADVVSGMAAGFAIANLFFIAFSGITTATGVLLGRTLGSGDLEKAKELKDWLLTAAFLFGLIMAAVGLLTVLLIPVVFGALSENALAISRNMVVFLSFFMPAWVYENAQMAVGRAGGDAAMGVWTDTSITLIVQLPLAFLLALFTPIGPVEMYMLIKLADLVKIIFSYFWLKKERWLHCLAQPGME